MVQEVIRDGLHDERFALLHRDLGTVQRRLWDRLNGGPGSSRCFGGLTRGFWAAVLEGAGISGHGK